MLVVRTWQPGFDPKRPCEKPGTVSHIWYPSTPYCKVGGKGRRMGWKLMDQLTKSTQHSKKERLCFKNAVERTPFPLTSTDNHDRYTSVHTQTSYTWIHKHTHTHACAHTQRDRNRDRETKIQTQADREKTTAIRNFNFLHSHLETIHRNSSRWQACPCWNLQSLVTDIYLKAGLWKVSYYTYDVYINILWDFSIKVGFFAVSWEHPT